MNNRYLAIADIIGRICICLYFIPAMVGRVVATQEIFAHGDLELVDLVTVTANLATVLFGGMICVTTITRLPPVRSAEGVEGYITALLGTFLLIAVIGYLPHTIEIPMFARLTALALTIIGSLASVYVLLFLGRAFSIMPEARTLVTTGPYAVVRNPLYLAEEIAVIGFIILNLSLWSIMLGIAHWLLQLRRMVNEERVLRATFPDYAAYAAAVPRVVPLLRTRATRPA
jgi:protein-S-isoprenylcysteine O-methyltransferase Ste14